MWGKKIFGEGVLVLDLVKVLELIRNEIDVIARMAGLINFVVHLNVSKMPKNEMSKMHCQKIL